MATIQNETLSNVQEQRDTFQFLGLRPSDKILIMRNDEGSFVLELAKEGNEIDLVDSREEVLTALKETLVERKVANVETQMEDLEHLSFPDNTFDVVIARASLRHFNDPERGLMEIHRVLKEYGKLLLYEMSFPASLKSLFESLSFIVRGEHAYYWNYNEILALLRETGFRAKLIRPSEYKSNNFTRRITDPKLLESVREMLLNLDDEAKQQLRFEIVDNTCVMWYETYDILATKL